jgi:hypothetical protein
MEKNRWIVLLAVGGLVLAGCAPVILAETAASEDPTEAVTVACDSGIMSETQSGRYRAWVLFDVLDPQQAAGAVADLLTEGEDAWVIVRADVVTGDYNLVVPVDAANAVAFQAAQEALVGRVGSEPAAILCVLSHVPEPPHGSHTFVTEGELGEFYLREYDPPGRHPQSPGANPWG